MTGSLLFCLEGGFVFFTVTTLEFIYIYTHTHIQNANIHSKYIYTGFF